MPRSDRVETPSGASNRAPLIGLVFGIAALLAVNVAWFQNDDSPAIYDMAHHLSLGWQARQALGDGNLGGLFHLSDYYPPLVHWTLAISYVATGPRPAAALLANLGWVSLLALSVYRLGCRMAGPWSAAVAAVVVIWLPMNAWWSREAMLDLPLTASVAAATLLLIEACDSNQRRRWLVLGLALGLGMLVKWTFILFLAPPLVFCMIRMMRQRHGFPGKALPVAHWLDAVLVAVVVAFPWYILHLQNLRKRFSSTMAEGLAEGDPSTGSLSSLTFYIQSLLSYHLFAVFFVLAVIGVLVALYRRNRIDLVLLIQLAGGWVFLTLLTNKDPRYLMPLVPMLVLLGTSVLRSWWWLAAVALAFAQLLAVSFDIGLPQRIRIAESPVPVWQERWLHEENHREHSRTVIMRSGWDLFQTSYAGMIGPPRKEDWKVNAILERVVSDAAVGSRRPLLALVPDMPRFHAGAFQLQTNWRGWPVTISRPRVGADWDALEGFDYVVIKEGNQGPPWTTVQNAEIDMFVKNNPAYFKVVELYPLPDGSWARLCRIERPL
ncbi:MAG: ArnT family glycosyltransferase [Acidobacteriota bacterium]